MAVAVTWDLKKQFRAWLEPEAKDLITELDSFGRIVTFNGDRFDFEVIRAYGEVRPLLSKSFDVLTHIYRQTGFRVKLDHLAEQTLGVRKTGDGIQSVQWWREGQRDKVIQYCMHDVEILLRLVAHARQNGHVVIDRKRVSVDWSPMRTALTKSAASGR